jgi:hypothetical protein
MYRYAVEVTQMHVSNTRFNWSFEGQESSGRIMLAERKNLIGFKMLLIIHIARLLGIQDYCTWSKETLDPVNSITPAF